MLKTVGAAAAVAVSACVSPAWAWPPVWLTPNSWGNVMGTTSAQLPDLAGTVIHDRVREFEIKNAAGAIVFKGKLQDRIVRSSATDDLIFSYRVRDTDPAYVGDMVAVDAAGFADIFGLHADYRPDGLGTETPSRASRSADGAVVRFTFWPAPIDGGESSKFCFIKPPGIEEYEDGGVITLRLFSGESAVLTGMKPIVP
jgi:hypothetical protein